METLHILKNVHHAFCSGDIVRLCSTVIGVPPAIIVRTNIGIMHRS